MNELGLIVKLFPFHQVGNETLITSVYIACFFSIIPNMIRSGKNGATIRSKKRKLKSEITVRFPFIMAL